MDTEQLAAHVATFTAAQLRALAASRALEHVVAGYAAELELIRRAGAADAWLNRGRGTTVSQPGEPSAADLARWSADAG